ncbi:hypothetical protein AB6A40_005805 [Gnathostoma spinigerum]|uniref:CHK kinase-like domain-containing protein n=1 Tax=Gnathostoma spinigerum TaxID=75299 RepID=A0ABD6EIL4_9BILA
MASYTSFQIKTKDVSERKGFLSKIFRIRFEFGESDVQPYDVVAKIPISSKLTQITGDENSQYDSVKDQMIMAVHNVECEFYSCHHVENLRIPKTFFCQKFEETEENQGAIIMEYQANAVSLPLHQSYSFPQLRALAEQIALLQAYSLSISLECFPNPSLPEEIIDFYSDLLREGCDNVSEENSKLTEAYLRLKPLFTSKHSLKRLSCELSECLGITRVLAHGDLWNNNLMWKLNEDGSCSDELACILDWQTFRFGMFPLSSFL